MEIVARRENFEYQTLHLSAGDVASLVNVVARASSDALRLRLAAELLKGMSDVELLTTLNGDLKTRLQKRHVRPAA